MLRNTTQNILPLFLFLFFKVISFVTSNLIWKLLSLLSFNKVIIIIWKIFYLPFFSSVLHFLFYYWSTLTLSVSFCSNKNTETDRRKDVVEKCAHSNQRNFYIIIFRCSHYGIYIWWEVLMALKSQYQPVSQLMDDNLS